MSDVNTGLPVRLFDEDFIPYSSNNPMPVSIEESEGDEIHDYQADADVLKAGGTAEHIYTVSAGKLMNFEQVLFAGAGRLKIDVQVETGVASDVYETIATGLSSTSKLGDEISFKRAYNVAAGVRIKVLKTNLDNQDFDIYSTIVGVEK